MTKRLRAMTRLWRSGHDYAEAHCNRGNALKELKHYQEALASYDKALALNPDYAEVHFNRGLVLNEIKRYEDALASYDKALTLRSNYAEAYSSRGNALQELKRFEDALESYDKALSMKPNNVEPGHTIHRTPDGDSAWHCRNTGQQGTA